MYAHSAHNHTKSTGEAIGVVHDWPLNCYDETYWKALSQLEQDMISKIPAANMHKIAKKLSKNSARGQQNSSSGPPGQRSTSWGKNQYQSPPGGSTQIVGESRLIEGPAPSGSMNVD